MSQIRFVDGQILFRDGSIAMAAGCCCGECDCSIDGFSISDLCLECAPSDFYTTTNTPRDWQIDISGVASGSATGLCGGTNPATCGDKWNTHTSFFDRSIILGPCDFYEDYECIWLCKYFDGINNGYHHIVEMNQLVVAVNKTTGPARSALVELRSYHGSKFLRTDQADSEACSSLGNNPGLLTFLLSSRVCEYEFLRQPPAVLKYKWDTTTCPPGTDVDPICENPIVEEYSGCVPEDWEITPTGSTVSGSYSCERALDVSTATVTVKAV